ncbi:unnamed protein product [Caenorhabditis nigoni]
MKILLSVLFVLCLATIVTSHKKDKDEVKKIVKVIEFDDDVVEGRSSIGRKGNKKISSSPYSSSWSSEEHSREACDDGWLEFKRPNGIWCILVAFSGVTNGMFSQQDAQNTCTGMGAVLTGFQNENERMTVARKALNKLAAIGQTVGGLWVGATNLPGCRVFPCGPHNTFKWTDGDTT